jgi:phosphoadenosine phosphosulfate reductase
VREVAVLIRSPRHTAADLAAWERLERYDRALATSPRLARLEERAIDVIRAFAAAGPCYAGVSWGKDSVVVAHLVLRADVGIPIAWFPAGRVENPDCALVRDAFLAMHPGIDYREIEAAGDMLPAFAPGDELVSGEAGAHVGHDGYQAEFERVSRLLGRRYISGVRAEESGIRKLRMRISGVAGRNTCRPIGWWKGEDVFAYLAKWDLPIHPAYAMSFGGALDRRTLRVSTIGGERGRRFGRREWEARYYPETLAVAEGRDA